MLSTECAMSLIKKILQVTAVGASLAVGAMIGTAEATPIADGSLSFQVVPNFGTGVTPSNATFLDATVIPKAILNVDTQTNVSASWIPYLPTKTSVDPFDGSTTNLLLLQGTEAALNLPATASPSAPFIEAIANFLVIDSVLSFDLDKIVAINRDANTNSLSFIAYGTLNSLVGAFDSTAASLSWTTTGLGQYMTATGVLTVPPVSVPTPSTIAILGLGLVGLGVVARRKDA